MNDLLLAAIEANRNEKRLRAWRAKKEAPKVSRTGWAGWFLAGLILCLTALGLVLAPPDERVVSETEDVTITLRASK